MDKEKIVFVPSCLLCPLMIARKDRADASWSQEIISYLIEKGYFMIQMPCPEASFPDHATGIARKPHGLKYYQELSGFRDYCSDIGKQVLEQIDAFYDNGYKTTGTRLVRFWEWSILPHVRLIIFILTKEQKE